jgi:hypothetical protein
MTGSPGNASPGLINGVRVAPRDAGTDNSGAMASRDTFYGDGRRPSSSKAKGGPAAVRGIYLWALDGNRWAASSVAEDGRERRIAALHR